MASMRGKYWRSIIAIVILIGAVWGIDLAVHQSRVSEAKAAKTAVPGLVNLGLDLQGGISVVLGPKDPATADKGSLEKARDIIAQRVDGLGVAEPDIAIQGSDIAVQLPGLTKATEALQLIGTTAKLSFRPVLANLGPYTPPTKDTPQASDVNCADPTTFPNDVADKEVVYCVRSVDSQTDREQPRDTWTRLRLGPVALQGEDVSGARAELSGQLGGGWGVSLDLTKQGTAKFAEVTGKLACNPLGDATRQLAIVLDKIIESSPQMGENVQCNQGIDQGTAQITGSFSQNEATNLALVLRYGALPIELQAQTTTTVSPTLGRDSLRGGLLAGFIGLLVVFLYVLIFYRALGVVILLGQTIGFALTLAGIAGLIVSLGIAVDSFIVYLERIKDEVRHGRTVRASVDRAWASAWRTILAADLVTALAAAVLYMLAVGSVRGFALMLGLSTALDVFVSRMYMHPTVWLLAQGKTLSNNKTLGMGSVAGMHAPAPVAGGQS